MCQKKIKYNNYLCVFQQLNIINLYCEVYKKW
nr:MAG TPA: hypothetical protein [Caudoviricetes sp.]